MVVELEKLAAKFRRRCKTFQDWEDLRQNVYLIFYEHRDSYDESKSSFNTWCNGYLFKKVLTFVESAPMRNSARFIPTDELPTMSTTQLSLGFVRALRKVSKDDWYAINKYDTKLVHHRRGPFARNIKKIAKVLEKTTE